jgi:formylglycine-generating enzyme required for sulfatase activity/DNA replication protein DnaC
MKRKKLKPFILIVGVFILSLLVLAQAQPEKKNSRGFDVKFWAPVLIGVAGFVFLVIQYFRRKKDEMLKKIGQLEAELEFKNRQLYKQSMTNDAKRKKTAELEADKEFKHQQQLKEAGTAEEMYCAALREELSVLQLPGSPDIECRAVRLQDAFVSLSISENWRSEQRFADREEMPEHKFERLLSPEQAMKRAFQNYHLLLVIGDPGSGKTTLLKYYAVNCLDKIYQKYRSLGFSRPILPIYFPLRELEFANEKGENNQPVTLAENLSKWCERHHLDISKDHFNYWLHHRHTLVLLDGLDEISITNQRQKVCKWIKRMCTGLGNARFVVTSRVTGYRKLDGIELEVPHLRADIMDFSPGQQEEFLKKWFRAVCRTQLPPVDMDMPEQKWQELQEKRAHQQSQTIIEFLKKEENKSVQELAAVPMLLQIMAILWKERQYLPQTRTGLYDVALDYLLDYRDRQKGIEPLLPADDARRVLSPTALWMQEELKKDEAPKQAMHQHMQIHLDTLKKDRQYPAGVFCQYLRDRTGVIADYDKNHYIFRHKSFREFLSGMQLKEEAHEDKRLISVINHFKEDWWEESLRFFISKSNPVIFDRLMRLFFQSPVSEQLDAHQQTLLQHLVREAPQKKIHALKEHLNSNSLNSHQRRYVMECLKTIGTPEAIKAIEKADKSKFDESNLSYADDIVAEATAKPGPVLQKIRTKEPLVQNSFRNPFEYNVEYIKIPGGTYRYSVSKQTVTVPDLYFCKYPVTNKRYRRFISYLAGKEKELEKELSLDLYAERLLKFADTIKGYPEYMGKDASGWKNEFRSQYDDDKKLNGNDQPVVGVTWYAARAYCFWLSCLDAALTKEKQLLTGDTGELPSIYRLPTEEEWEWAAGGEPDGSMRKYPWPKDKGEPGKNLANFNKNVDATTPVDRYPEGATPLGLMDMAGNVWEWMENYSSESKEYMALRGGAYYSDKASLVCSARGNLNPLSQWDYVFGFRVLRASHP